MIVRWLTDTTSDELKEKRGRYEIPAIQKLSTSHRAIIAEANGIEKPRNAQEWDAGEASLWLAGKLDINQFRNQWVCGYEQVINKAAQRFGILSRLLEVSE